MTDQPIERPDLVLSGKRLEYFTLGYNMLEGVLAVGMGAIAGSIALVGFGFDSAIEVVSGLTLLWRLHSDFDEHRREAVEKRALKIVGVLFLLLAAYVLYDSVHSIVAREEPRESIPGIVLAAASVLIMPVLAKKKRTVARLLGSDALDADAMQTQLCTYLSAILLGGLALNAIAGWWWADPVAALVMVPIIAREGIEALREKQCHCH